MLRNLKQGERCHLVLPGRSFQSSLQISAFPTQIYADISLSFVRTWEAVSRTFSFVQSTLKSSNQHSWVSWLHQFLSHTNHQFPFTNVSTISFNYDFSCMVVFKYRLSLCLQKYDKYKSKLCLLLHKMTVAWFLFIKMKLSFNSQ